MAALTIFTSITKKKTKILEYVSCIWYAMMFKDKTDALFDLESKVNIMSQAFALKLGLKIRKTNIKIEKIDCTTLKTYVMVVFMFFVLDKNDKERFFEKNFLLANMQLDIVFGSFFLTISNIYVNFQA